MKLTEDQIFELLTTQSAGEEFNGRDDVFSGYMRVPALVAFSEDPRRRMLKFIRKFQKAYSDFLVAYPKWYDPEVYKRYGDFCEFSMPEELLPMVRAYVDANLSGSFHDLGIEFGLIKYQEVNLRGWAHEKSPISNVGIDAGMLRVSRRRYRFVVDDNVTYEFSKKLADALRDVRKEQIDRVRDALASVL